MTRDEFGLNLFNTIKIIGGILSIDSQHAVAMRHEETDKMAALLVRRDDLRKTLAKQLPSLNDTEMSELLVHYPWIVTM
jgi:hypothetical protein